MARIIEILVSPTGETTLQTRGYAGADCQQASKLLEHALGVKTNERLTPEYYESQPQKLETQQ